MVYILFPISKESRKNFYPRQDLNPGPRPQSKSDDLDRSAIGPAICPHITLNSKNLLNEQDILEPNKVFCAIKHISIIFS